MLVRTCSFVLTDRDSQRFDRLGWVVVVRLIACPRFHHTQIWKWPQNSNPYLKYVLLYGGQQTGLRGQSPNILILEEAAFLNPRVFFEAIAPLMGNENVAVLGISTPNNDEGNYYSALLELERAPGDPLFRIINLEVACKACKEAGTPEQCEHKVELLPPWRTEERKDILKQVYKDHPELFAQENLGLQQSSKRFWFRPQWIEQFKSNTGYAEFPNRVDVLYSAVDPAGGGKPSDYAIVTTTFHRGRIVVCLRLRVHFTTTCGRYCAAPTPHAGSTCTDRSRRVCRTDSWSRRRVPSTSAAVHSGTHAQMRRA